MTEGNLARDPEEPSGPLYAGLAGSLARLGWDRPWLAADQRDRLRELLAQSSAALNTAGRNLNTHGPRY